MFLLVFQSLFFTINSWQLYEATKAVKRLIDAFKVLSANKRNFRLDFLIFFSHEKNQRLQWSCVGTKFYRFGECLIALRYQGWGFPTIDNNNIDDVVYVVVVVVVAIVIAIAASRQWSSRFSRLSDDFSVFRVFRELRRREET